MCLSFSFPPPLSISFLFLLHTLLPLPQQILCYFPLPSFVLLPSITAFAFKQPYLSLGLPHLTIIWREVSLEGLIFPLPRSFPYLPPFPEVSPEDVLPLCPCHLPFEVSSYLFFFFFSFLFYFFFLPLFSSLLFSRFSFLSSMEEEYGGVNTVLNCMCQNWNIISKQRERRVAKSKGGEKKGDFLDVYFVPIYFERQVLGMVNNHSEL